MNNSPRRFLPSHAVLRSFEAAARHKSFTLAAKELQLTQSAISRQVKELEMTVGSALFRRVGRHVVLTRAGENLAKDLSVDLENIRRTMLRAIAGGETGTTLSVACLPTFASRWLIPRLPAFGQAYPDIEINLSTRLKPFDLEVEHFDLAIHYGRENWPNTDMTPFCSETLAAVASPKFQDYHNIKTIEDISKAPLLQLTTRPMAWQEYFQSCGLQDMAAKPGKYFDQFSMIIAGALSCLGAGLIPIYLIEDELRTGALIKLNPSTITTKNQYFLVTSRKQQNEHVASFCTWMKGCLSAGSIH